jgi:hypothetical protein
MKALPFASRAKNFADRVRDRADASQREKGDWEALTGGFRIKAGGPIANEPNQAEHPPGQ